MNRLKYFLFVVVLVLFFGSVQNIFAKGLVLGLSQSKIDISSTLKKGSAGEEVSKLQEFLIDTEYLKIEDSTGYFGPQTEEAVKKLQDSVGLKPDGIVGEQTRTFFKIETVSDILSTTSKEDFVADDSTKKQIRDCEDGDKFSMLTGKPCVEEKDSEVVSTVPGCDKAEYIFSPLSGKRCDGGGSVDDQDETDDSKDDDEDVDDDREDEEDDSSDDEEDSSDTSDDSDEGHETLGRIMFWYGKVNQHTDANGNWQTDPDGVSGAGTYAQFGNEGYGDRKLEYCQKFYPNTKSVVAYEMETISTWKERGNVNNWTSTKLSYLCKD